MTDESKYKQSSRSWTSIFSGARVKELIRKYGKVALGVHLVVYTSFLGGCYIAVSQKVDVKSALTKVGLLSDKPDVVPEDQSWFERLMSGGGSTLALAILCNKALFPIRTPITLALTPPVARFLRSRKIIKN